MSALLGSVFANRLMRVSDGGARDLADYQMTFAPLIIGVALAIVLAFFLRETGTATQAGGPLPSRTPTAEPIG